MNRSKIYFLIILIIATPVIIFIYFYKWRTLTIHDDDLYIYRVYQNMHSFHDRINLSTAFSQFRPVRDILLNTLIRLLGENFKLYYYFNVFVQSINCVLLAYILNIFLRSYYLSLLISLAFSLSRFSYYNMTQLFNGGMLEGVAITFFLLFFLTIARIFTEKHADTLQPKKHLLCGILYANLCMYTHERYIVLLGFLFLLVLFLQFKKKVTVLMGMFLLSLIILSGLLNVAIKEYVFSIPFFTGTGNTVIQFSPFNALDLLIKAGLSLLQVSIGAEYLVGLQFVSLPILYKVIVVVLICLIVLTLGRYFAKLLFRKGKEQRQQTQYFYFAFFLFFLFGLLLIPGIVQIRMELRWLQGPLVILMTVIAISLSSIANLRTRNSLGILIALCFLVTNKYYIDKGAKNLYYSTAATIGNAFDAAIKNGDIKRGKTKLYVWEKKRIPDREGEIKWALVDGYFFRLYQKENEQIIFIDSLYEKNNGSSYKYTLPRFDSNTDQVVFINIQNDDQTFKYSITNLTDQYLKDSLRSFSY